MLTAASETNLPERREGGKNHQERGAARLLADGDRRWWIILTTLLTLSSLPLWFETMPEPGLDPSWHLGLSLAQLNGLDHGHDLVFTFGPLGFVAYPTAVSMTPLIFGVAYAVASAAAAYGAALLSARRWLDRSLAALVTGCLAFVAPAVGAPELGAIGLALLAIAVTLPERFDRALPAWVPPLLGMLSAGQLLVKFSVGTFFVVVSLAICLHSGRWRAQIVAWATSAVVSLAVFWLATGQSLGDLDDWLRLSVRMALGYTSAMALPGFDLEQRLAVLALLVLVGVVVVRVDQTRAAGLRARGSGLLIYGASALFFAKAGTVRLDPSHLRITLVAAAALLLSVPWPRERRFPAAVAVVVVAASSLLITGLTLGRTTIAMARLHVRAPANLAEITSYVLEPGLRREHLEIARREILAHHEIREVPSDLPGDLHADPWDIAAVWAVGRQWTPTPIVQAYAAYTTELDDHNAEFLIGPEAPSGIISTGAAIDGRFPAWESPAYQLAVTCRYRPSGALGDFEVLRRGPSRCSTPLLRTKARIEPGQTIDVPAPARGALLAARFTLPERAFDRVAAALLRPVHTTQVLVNGDRHRFVTGTAPNLHLLRVPPAVRGSSLWWGGLQVDSLQFPDVRGPVTVRFFEVRLESP